MKAVGYARVSTDGQADRGHSLPAQKAKIAALAALHDAELIEVVVDAESGRDLDRPGVQRVIDLVRHKAVDAVMISTLSRLTRSVRDAAELLALFERNRVRLCSAGECLDTATAGGKLVVNVLTAFSAWELDVISERTRAVLQHKKAMREYCGSVPYGFRRTEDGKHVEPDAGEQRVRNKLIELRESGLSLRRVAAELNRRGYRTRAGSEWRLEYVVRILKAA